MSFPHLNLSQCNLILIIQQTILFERLGLSDVKSRILAACNGTEYFFIALLPLVLIDRIGRRKLMLFGAIGQCITMVLLAVLGEVDNSPAQVISAVLLFVFNSFFALGWLGMTWLYVSTTELLSLNVRLFWTRLACRDCWSAYERPCQRLEYSQQLDIQLLG